MMPPIDPLHERLEALYRQTDHQARLVADPLAFVHRYHQPDDQEIAGLFAAGFAFGRVDLFRPVLASLFDTMDTFGGPAAFVDGLDALRAQAIAGLIYRWNRGPDVSLLCAALGAVRREGPLQDLFRGPGDLRARLSQAVTTLRRHAVHAAGTSDFSHLPRGLRYLLPSPEDGSACKRWNLFLRWMVRPPVEGLDRGLWRSISPAELIIPVDTHVGRLARFLGLTRRADPSWRTAEQITAALRRYDPADPLRYDFALAHLGISGACLGYRSRPVCHACPLDTLCTATPSQQGHRLLNDHHPSASRPG